MEENWLRIRGVRQLSYILALDQGTTSSRAIVYNVAGEKIAVAQQELAQIFPQPGWVEHNPLDIWDSQLHVAQEVIAKAGLKPRDIVCLGITNQRETTVVWDKATGEPLHNAIVWQCRRTADFCEQLRRQKASRITSKTGLVIDAYFSASKISWLLDNVPGLRDKAEKGEALFGTVDSWLLYKLTGGAVHATDYSNASRTMLFNIHTLVWDEELLDVFGVPRAMLPQVLPSGSHFGTTHTDVFGASIPITALIGDQQAALFGQGCFAKGDAKNTYGTGCFLLFNTGTEATLSLNGLLTTIAWGIGDEVIYALEGSVFVAGAAIQWLRDGLELLDTAADSETLATQVNDNQGVYLVPAFTGLGAPYWDPYARGTMVGLTRGTTRAHIIRAALESIAYQTEDVIQAMCKDAGITPQVLRVDGGATDNNFLMQFQADISNMQVERPQDKESTARGAVFMAGLTHGIWRRHELSSLIKVKNTWQPELAMEKRRMLYQQWQQAVGRSQGWAK